MPGLRKRRVGGQSMVEYSVILAFGVLVLMGPGGDVMLDLREAMKNKYRGYSYAMSLSTMPDFGTGPRLEQYIEDLNLDPEVVAETIERLTVDPVQEHVDQALQPVSDAYQAFTDIGDMLGDFEDLDDLAVQMLEDAISPF